MLWRFAPMIYGPTLLFGLGEGALLPVLPSIASGMGADVPEAAFVASVIVVARMIGNLPAGWLVDRIGERYTMAIAGAVALLGTIGVIFAPDVAVMSVAVFGVGFSAAAFGLARHAFMTTRVPLGYRARSLSILGGSFRFGLFVGPFVGALLLVWTTTDTSAAWFFAAMLALLILLVLLGRDPEEELAAEGLTPSAALRVADDLADDTGESTTGSIPAAERQGVFRTMWRNRAVLARLGLSAATLSGIRQARVYLTPLWGVSLGMDASTISLVVGLTGGLEFLLFYSSGQIMDRWGRLWACLPSMVIMSGAFLALAFTHDLRSAVSCFIVVAILVGIGNGLSSGILMTIGADVAPVSEPAPFLGSWRTLTDVGGAAIPVIIAAVSAAATLPIATAVVGVIGLAGAVGFWRYVPRYVPHPA
ncbi:MAG: MFS transporter [Microbacterium sp.]